VLSLCVTADANGVVYRVVDFALKALAASGNYGGLDLAKADQIDQAGRTLTQTYTAAPIASFHDASPTAYYNSAIPTNSVRTAGSGLKIDITGVSADRGSYQVHVYQEGD
jgi:hypothetical protein